jgi:hypothetical protein
MELGLRHGGGRLGQCGFYRARASRRCGGGEVVQRATIVDASMYRLRECSKVGRRGNRGAGRCEKGKRRR